MQENHVDAAVDSFVELLTGVRDTILKEAAGKYLDSIESFVEANGSVGKSLYNVPFYFCNNVPLVF